MRRISFALLSVMLLASVKLHAAAISPEESKLQTEFNKAYRVPDKEARKSAITMMEGAKHPSSWQLLMGAAGSDPEPEVRLAAFTALAKEPARDTSVARMLVQLYSNVKFNDFATKLSYAKAMEPSVFKYDITAALVEHLTKMRYPDVPKLMQMGNGQTNQQAIANAEKVRKEFEDLLEALNAIEKTEVTKPTKESPNLLSRWFQSYAPKIVAADKELVEKNKKEDADAAKAAKEAAAKK